MGTSVMNKVVFEEIREEEGNRNEKGSCSNESSSSSIGKNSDLSDDLSEILGDDDDDEVESNYKGPLDAMDALEQVLPIRRGISRFYNGKSKSFASLADASSVKEIAKPSNPYARKRTNMLTRNITPLRANGSGNGNGGGISKKMMTNSNSLGRSALALAVAMNNSESVHNNHNNNKQTVMLSASSPPRKVLCSLRSFSLADLHCVSGVAVNLHELGAKMD